MKDLVLWIAVALMALGAMLIAIDVGAVGLWIGVITLGIAMVAVDRYRRQGHRHA